MSSDTKTYTHDNYPGRIKTRFTQLLLDKQSKDGRRYTYKEIKDITGIARSTLSAYAKNKPTVKAYKLSTIARLCYFFDCEVGDLIVYERE